MFAANRSFVHREDAFRCFMGTEIEALAIGNCFLQKKDQDPALELDYKTSFPPD